MLSNLAKVSNKNFSQTDWFFRLDVWDASNATANKYRITSANPQFVDFGDKYVPTVHWICDGMDNDIQTTTLGGDTKKWYVNLHTETKAPCLPFGKDSGRISWETPGLE